MERRSIHHKKSLIDEESGGLRGGGVRVRYFAAARVAAGTTEESVPAGVGLDELATQLGERHGERLATVLKVVSFLVDGVTWHDRQAPLPPGVTVDVLPPFAGG